MARRNRGRGPGNGPNWAEIVQAIAGIAVALLTLASLLKG